MRISLCTVKSFNPGARTATGARADRGQSPRMGIMALAHWMDKEGIPRDSWDFYDIDMLLPPDEAIEQYFREYNPQIIGLSAIVCSYYVELKRIAAIARRACPDAWIVMGGHLSASANVILPKTEVDICVAGDGEYPWIDLLRYFERNGRTWVYGELAKIKGIAYLDHAKDLRFTGYAAGVLGSEFVQPDYDLLLKGLKDQPELLNNFFSDILEMAGYVTMDPRVAGHWSHKVGQMVSSKGCVAKCNFCQRASKGYRRAEADSLEEHLLYLKNTHGVGVIQFTTEENFGSDVKQAYEIARMMKRHDMLWIPGSMRVTTFTAEDLKFLKEHGALGGVYGLESGSLEMLELIEKKITPDDIVQAFQSCVEADFMSPQSVWLVGFPGDTEATIMETGRTSGRVAHILGVPPTINQGGIAYVIPIPGTPLYEYGQQQGVIPTDVDGEERFLEHLAQIHTAYRHFYTNLNGAPDTEVVFWELLLRMEASRTYRELCKAEPRGPTTMGQRIIAMRENQEREGLVNISLRQRVTTFAWAVDNRLLHALPRWLVYPVIKYAYFMLHGVLRDTLRVVLGRPDTVFTRKRAERLVPKVKHGQRIASLRSLVKETGAADNDPAALARQILVRGQ